MTVTKTTMARAHLLKLNALKLQRKLERSAKLQRRQQRKRLHGSQICVRRKKSTSIMSHQYLDPGEEVVAAPAQDLVILAVRRVI